jgi:hypothetical protein
VHTALFAERAIDREPDAGEHGHDRDRAALVAEQRRWLR